MPKPKSTKSKAKKPNAKGKTKAKKAIQKPKRSAYKRACKQEILITKPVLACKVTAMLKGRKDQALLKTHLKAIAAHKQKYQARVDQAVNKQKKGDASEVHAIPANKAKVTEAIGEHEATLHMLQNYVKDAVGKEFQLVWHFSAGTGFDQLWVAGMPNPTTYLIVEAKGPGATLSTSAAKGDQMSKMWVTNTLQEVMNSPSASASDKAHAKAMQTAMAKGPPPNVFGKVVEANPGGGAKEVTCPDKGIYHKTK